MMRTLIKVRKRIIKTIKCWWKRHVVDDIPEH